ncbi:DUF6505 family protein [Rhodovibrio salinarum]|uniref:Uncharacterized protein n=1 Tax=Rhodovibrio salinarum TaxID=1087 RepID=A0A934QJD6_9PROT|nr:DUF6505 family protein [Rhodovibrio salinarum]MBK1697530.1 hypothetical protein [Rhodovibrio salinarum]
MKFPRVIRLDGSDPRVYARAAEPGEPAVTGTFAFADTEPESLAHADRLAFAGGWLGTESFGRATLVEVAKITEATFFQIVEQLARHFVDHYGAPSLTEALPVAREECDYAAGLCDHPMHTLLAIERAPSDEGVRERIKVIQPSRADEHTKIWEIGADDGAS